MHLYEYYCVTTHLYRRCNVYMYVRMYTCMHVCIDGLRHGMLTHLVSGDMDEALYRDLACPTALHCGNNTCMKRSAKCDVRRVSKIHARPMHGRYPFDVKTLEMEGMHAQERRHGFLSPDKVYTVGVCEGAFPWMNKHIDAAGFSRHS
jgi:hypothetical protein